MNIDKIKGTQLCLNCIYLGEKGKCKNKKASQLWFTNQRNGCDFFDGKLVNIDWNKAVPIGYRPSIISK